MIPIMPRLLQNRLGVNSKRYVLWETFYDVVFGLQQHLLWHWSNCWGLVCLQVELLQESDGMNILEWTGREVNVWKWESETRKAGMEHPSPVGTFNCILLLPVQLDCCHHCWVTENDLEHVMVHVVWIHGCMWFEIFLLDHSHVLVLLDSTTVGNALYYYYLTMWENWILFPGFWQDLADDVEDDNNLGDDEDNPVSFQLRGPSFVM